MLDFTGRLHPLFVHMPIGMLLLAAVFIWLMKKKTYAGLQTAVTISLFLGMLGAVFSCVTGLFLSGSGEYESDLVFIHQWLGIALAVVTVILFFLHRRWTNARATRWITLVMVAMIFITGHFGGTLTHGQNYLTEAFDSPYEGPAIPAIANIQEAEVYNDAIRPLLQSRCYSCHGPDKEKGELRLDQPEFILKGGENGKVIIPGRADESDLAERIFLPIDDDDHMPPRKRAQLTPQETSLIHWWISSGAPFDKKFNELPQDEKIAPVLFALQSGTSTEKETTSYIPQTETVEADFAAVERLRKNGVIVLPVAQNSNYLGANFVSAPTAEDSVLQLLGPLQKQLILLNLADQDVRDEDLQKVSGLKNLAKLYLTNTAITDKGLTFLTGLTNLQYLNLTGTTVTAEGLKQLSGLNNLKSIYLYKTNISGTEWDALQQIFPKAYIDSGGYHVPTLPSDTTEVKW